MKDKNKSRLSPNEAIKLAERVNHWTKTREGEGEDGLKINRYTGGYFGVRLNLSDTYDPTPYEGHGTHISLIVSFDKFILGKYEYDYQKTEGTVDFDRGVKKLQGLVTHVEKLPSRRGFGRDDALAYARRLILEGRKSRAK